MHFPLFIEIPAVLFLGLVLGSFATALVWRTEQEKSWIFDHENSKRVFARSACPSCGTVLKARDLVPLFSWLFLRGKCRYCQTPIGAVYPVTELLTLAAVLGTYAAWGLSVSAALFIVALPFLVALLVIDSRHMILPDGLVLPVGVAGVFFVLYQCFVGGLGGGVSCVAMGVLGAFLYAGLAWGLGALMKIILKKEALGMGDVKFFAVAGLWLGAAQLPVFLMSAGFLGMLWGLFFRIFYKEQLFPFGPALIVSFYLCNTLKINEIMLSHMGF